MTDPSDSFDDSNMICYRDVNSGNAEETMGVFYISNHYIFYSPPRGLNVLYEKRQTESNNDAHLIRRSLNHFEKLMKQIQTHTKTTIKQPPINTECVDTTTR